MAEVIIVGSAVDAGALVADEIVRLVRADAETVLGLATGSTPLPVYEALRPRLADVDVSRVTGFALDEYVGLDPSHSESYRSVLFREVVEPLMNERMRKRLVSRESPDTRILREAMRIANGHLDYVDYLLDHRRWLAGPGLSLADFTAAAIWSGLCPAMASFVRIS